ncbi:MAG: peptidylprolyl isomerase [Bacteroidota bacterium]
MKILLFLVIILSGLCAAQNTGEIPIATVGTITITDKEFQSRYELTPGLYRTKSRTEKDKSDFLLSLIAEKLLVLEAEQKGWDRDTARMSGVMEVERLLVRDELYRREVSGKVSISDAELDAGMRNARDDIKVYFLYSATEHGARTLYDRIQKGTPLESFTFSDSTSGEFAGPDSVMVRWGDADERMERAIYSLKLGETSAPIKLEEGWYIVKVMGKTVTVVAGEKERAALRERVESTLRKRKELSRMDEFMRMELRSKKADVNARLLKSIVEHLWDDAQERNPGRSDSVTYFVDYQSIELLRKRMKDSMAAAAVVMPHTVWSVEQMMERIRETNLATPRPSLQRIRTDVEQRLREILDQEFLAEIGYAKGLHLSNAVRNDMKVWRDAYRAQIVRSSINDTIVISREEMEEIRRVFRHDTAIVMNDDKAREKAFEIKSNYFVDRVVGEFANAASIRIDEENFRNLRVTATPSMVFRYLGFGGRMFAVPFVIPQVGWIQYWKTSSVALP